MFWNHIFLVENEEENGVQHGKRYSTARDSFSVIPLCLAALCSGVVQLRDLCSIPRELPAG